MERYVEFVERFKAYIIAFVLIATIGFSYFLKDLAFEGSYRIWFGEDSQILNSYDKFRRVFGNDESVMIVFRSEDGVFNKKAVDSINRITDFLWQTKYITRVDSLANYQYIHSDPENPDEIFVDDFLPKGMSESELAEKERIALHDPLIVNKMISSDGKTTLIAGRLASNAGESEDISIYLYQTIEKLLEKEHGITGYKYWHNGAAAITANFAIIAMEDGSLYMPLAIISVGIILIFIFRGLSGSLIPMAVVFATFTIVMSIQVLLGYKLNNFTVNIPIFVTAIGIADAVHVYSIWLNQRRKGYGTKESIVYALKKNFLPILLTSLTTSAGFLSLAISDIVPISTLGISTASAAILAFILSVTLMPAILLYLKKDRTQAGRENGERAKIAKRYGAFIVANDKKIVAFTIVLFSVIGVGIFSARIDSNTIRYFHESTEIRKSTNFIQENLTGPMSYEVVTDSGSEGGIKEPNFLKTVDSFYKELNAKFPENIRNISSLNDIIMRFNEVFHGDDPNYFRVPDNQELIAQYLLLYSLSLPQGMEINDRMDVKERLLRITANVNIVDTSKDLEMIGWIEQWWSAHGYKATVEGQTAMFAYMQSSVTDTLINSMLLAILVISFIMILIFKRIKLLGVFLLPNIIPIALVLGVMGWLGIDIDMGVAVSGAIIIGVAVDDTIHFLVKFFDGMKKGESLEECFAEVLELAGSAILFTTMILSVSFLFFTGSVFMPNIHFGIVTASALTIALVADLLLLPAILSLIYKREGNSLKPRAVSA